MKVSYLMSLYSKENPKYLNDALLSLSLQTYIIDEIVLVIDGPITNELESVISKWDEALPFKLLRLDKNVGLAQALNKGLEICSNELVFRMDTDDVSEPNRTECQVRFMLQSNVDILGSQAVDIDENGNYIKDRQVPFDHETISKLIWCCPMIHPSVCFWKSSIKSIGSYAIDCPHRQDDYELWIRAENLGLKFANLPQRLIKYRTVKGYRSKNSFMVGVNRFKLGLPALIKNDLRLVSILSLSYPMIRSVLPDFLLDKFENWVSLFDPRTKKYEK
ncbi:glycosyltransferase [Vibrio vulnificus]|uniref:glycosyltransferase n=1 Tax=Vibrio vulnificus TaxID=672 RepID=UPI001EEA95E5|nr:glycosyltransferase [Vibrio vulnificus]MCG6298488.1 glycosyltransferase [Vibrio vulnificus]